MSIPLAWEGYSFPQPLGESVRAVLIYNEWKSERTEEVGRGEGLGGGTIGWPKIVFAYRISFFASYLSTGVLSHVY